MNDLKMGFKHTILQRLHSLEMCTTKHTTASINFVTSAAAESDTTVVHTPSPTTTVGGGGLVVTDFSISRILSESNSGVEKSTAIYSNPPETVKKSFLNGGRNKTSTATVTSASKYSLQLAPSTTTTQLDILDLSKSATSPNLGSNNTQLPPPGTIYPALDNNLGISPYHNLFQTDFLAAAAANATKFYAQFFPHIFPTSYSTAGGSFQTIPASAPIAVSSNTLLTTPTISTSNNTISFPPPYQKQRYFTPYIVNSTQNPPRPATPSNVLTKTSGGFCCRINCGECHDYYNIHPATYKTSSSTLPKSPRNSSIGLPSIQTQLSTKTNPEICTTITGSGGSSIIPTNPTVPLPHPYLKTKPESELLMKPRSQDVITLIDRTNLNANPSRTISNTSIITTEEISYKCRICDKVFGCSLTLQTHEKTHKSPRYECTDCGKGFSQLRNYKYHLSVHRGTKEFAAECPECGKTFNDKGYLSSHMKIHRNKKEYECPYCPKSFNQRVAFNMHVRIHTGVKPHKCAECGKRFSRKMLLKQHMRTHSGEKPYQCSVCGKSFADRSNMTLHHRLHSGIKPFNCPICPKAFTKKHHLKTHLNYHTGCKPYVCPHPNCKQAFTQSSNMRTHAKKCQYRPLALSYPVGGTSMAPLLSLPLTVSSVATTVTVTNSSGSDALAATNGCIPSATLSLSSMSQQHHSTLEQQTHLPITNSSQQSHFALHTQLPLSGAISAGIRMSVGTNTTTQHQHLATLRPF